MHLSKHILDYRKKKQTETLRISENINFRNDDIMNYVIGDLQQKLPRDPYPLIRLCVEPPNIYIYVEPSNIYV